MRAIRFVMAAALVMFAVPAAAQDGQGGGQRGPGGMRGNQAMMNEMMFKDITLTDAQKAAIDTIQTKASAATRELMQSGGMQDPATRQKMTEMRTKQNADIRAVLTAEQQVLFDRNLAAMPARGQRPPPPPRR